VTRPGTCVSFELASVNVTSMVEEWCRVLSRPCVERGRSRMVEEISDAVACRLAPRVHRHVNVTS
jgi:hypothetical protein